MKFYFAFILLAFGSLSCKEKIDPDGIVGDWGFAYEIRTKDANGNYGEWTQINTLVAVPPISFTADGQLLYDYKTPSECCTFRKYEVKGTQLLLSDPIICVNASCSDCSTWEIVKLSDDFLEIEYCNETQNRYYRLLE